MKRWIIVAVLVAGAAFFRFQIADLSEQISELRGNYTALQTSNNNLQVRYNTLETDHKTNLNDYNLLDANHRTLQSNLNSLNTDLQTLTVKYTGLEADFKALQINNNRLQTENSDLQNILGEYENVPHSYYSTGIFPKYSNTFEELRRFLSYDIFLPTYYKINVFDCSESAAYLEWALENAGFDAEILVGPTPWDTGSSYHAWVMAHTIDYQIAIEATALTSEYKDIMLFNNRIPGVVYEDDNLIQGWSNYYHGYDNKYRNIYHAIRDFGNPKEWNWWDGLSGFK